MESANKENEGGGNGNGGGSPNDGGLPVGEDSATGVHPEDSTELIAMGGGDGMMGATGGDSSTEGMERGTLSPLTGSYLLIVLAEPHSEEDREVIIQRLIKGLKSWDMDSSHVDLTCELLNLANAAPEGDEARNGEKLVQWASENLVVEVLIHCQVNTLLQCMKNLLSSFTRHRHIIHAGYTFQGSGSWILQDGTFSVTDFLELWAEPEVTRILGAYKGDISVSIHCATENAWTDERLRKESFSKLCQVRMNPPDKILGHSSGIISFVDYISKMLVAAPLKGILEPSEIVGNIRFSHPTLYVFPGGQGDAALFGINGFNMLIDGGFSRRSCFWEFTRHLDRLDAVLLTRVNNNAMCGLDAVLDRKRLNQVHPNIGHFFGNVMERKPPQNEIDQLKQDEPQPGTSSDLLVSLRDTGHRMVENLRNINLKPQHCYRESVIEPINLYHKVGHGKLDMYVLNPAKDSREVREFLSKWHSSDCKNFVQAKMSMKLEPGKEMSYPVLNLVSICALLVWQPDNPREPITRILFPGSTPQQKIFEALGKLKHLEFLKYPICSAKTLAASHKSRARSERVISGARHHLSSSVTRMSQYEKSSTAGDQVEGVRSASVHRGPSYSSVPSSKYGIRAKMSSQTVRSDSASTVTAEITDKEKDIMKEEQTMSKAELVKERKSRDKERRKTTTAEPQRIISTTGKTEKKNLANEGKLEKDNMETESASKKREHRVTSRRIDSSMSKSLISKGTSSSATSLASGTATPPSTGKASSRISSRIDTGVRRILPGSPAKKDGDDKPQKKYGIGVTRSGRTASAAPAPSATSPPSTPPKSAKDAVNRKVIETKTARRSLIDTSRHKEKDKSTTATSKPSKSSTMSTKSSKNAQPTATPPSAAPAPPPTTKTATKPSEPKPVKRPGAVAAAAVGGAVVAAGAASILSKEKKETEKETSASAPVEISEAPVTSNGISSHGESEEKIVEIVAGDEADDEESVPKTPPTADDLIEQHQNGLVVSSVPVTESSSEMSSLDHTSVNEEIEDKAQTVSEDVITAIAKDQLSPMQVADLPSESHTISEGALGVEDDEDILGKDISAGPGDGGDVEDEEEEDYLVIEKDESTTTGADDVEVIDSNIVAEEAEKASKLAAAAAAVAALEAEAVAADGAVEDDDVDESSIEKEVSVEKPEERDTDDQKKSNEEVLQVTAESDDISKSEEILKVSESEEAPEKERSRKSEEPVEEEPATVDRHSVQKEVPDHEEPTAAPPSTLLVTSEESKLEDSKQEITTEEEAVIKQASSTEQFASTESKESKLDDVEEKVADLLSQEKSPEVDNSNQIDVKIDQVPASTDSKLDIEEKDHGETEVAKEEMPDLQTTSADITTLITTIEGSIGDRTSSSQTQPEPIQKVSDIDSETKMKEPEHIEKPESALTSASREKSPEPEQVMTTKGESREKSPEPEQDFKITEPQSQERSQEPEHALETTARESLEKSPEPGDALKATLTESKEKSSEPEEALQAILTDSREKSPEPDEILKATVTESQEKSPEPEQVLKATETEPREKSPEPEVVLEAKETESREKSPEPEQVLSREKSPEPEQVLVTEVAESLAKSSEPEQVLGTKETESREKSPEPEHALGANETESREKSPEPEQVLSREKSPEPEKVLSREKSPEPENALSREKSPEPEKVLSREKSPEPENALSREKSPEPEKVLSREKSPEPEQVLVIEVAESLAKSSGPEQVLGTKETESREKSPEPEKALSREKSPEPEQVLSREKSPEPEQVLSREKSPEPEKVLSREKSPEPEKVLSREKSPEPEQTLKFTETESREKSPEPEQTLKSTETDSREKSPEPEQTLKSTKVESREKSPEPEQTLKATEAESREKSPEPEQALKAESREKSPEPEQALKLTEMESREKSPESDNQILKTVELTKEEDSREKSPESHETLKTGECLEKSLEPEPIMKSIAPSQEAESVETSKIASASRENTPESEQMKEPDSTPGNLSREKSPDPEIKNEIIEEKPINTEPEMVSESKSVCEQLESTYPSQVTDRVSNQSEKESHSDIMSDLHIEDSNNFSKLSEKNDLLQPIRDEVSDEKSHESFSQAVEKSEEVEGPKTVSQMETKTEDVTESTAGSETVESSNVVVVPQEHDSNDMSGEDQKELQVLKEDSAVEDVIEKTDTLVPTEDEIKDRKSSISDDKLIFDEKIAATSQEKAHEPFTSISKDVSETTHEDESIPVGNLIDAKTETTHQGTVDILSGVETDTSEQTKQLSPSVKESDEHAQPNLSKPATPELDLVASGEKVPVAELQKSSPEPIIQSGDDDSIEKQSLEPTQLIAEKATEEGIASSESTKEDKDKKSSEPSPSLSREKSPEPKDNEKLEAAEPALISILREKSPEPEDSTSKDKTPEPEDKETLHAHSEPLAPTADNEMSSASLEKSELTEKSSILEHAVDKSLEVSSSAITDLGDKGKDEIAILSETSEEVTSEPSKSREKTPEPDTSLVKKEIDSTTIIHEENDIKLDTDKSPVTSIEKDQTTSETKHLDDLVVEAVIEEKVVSKVESATFSMQPEEKSKESKPETLEEVEIVKDDISVEILSAAVKVDEFSIHEEHQPELKELEQGDSGFSGLEEDIPVVSQIGESQPSDKEKEDDLVAASLDSAQVVADSVKDSKPNAPDSSAPTSDQVESSVVEKSSAPVAVTSSEKLDDANEKVQSVSREKSPEPATIDEAHQESNTKDEKEGDAADMPASREKTPEPQLVTLEDSKINLMEEKSKTPSREKTPEPEMKAPEEPSHDTQNKSQSHSREKSPEPVLAPTDENNEHKSYSSSREKSPEPVVATTEDEKESKDQAASREKSPVPEVEAANEVCEDTKDKSPSVSREKTPEPEVQATEIKTEQVSASTVLPSENVHTIKDDLIEKTVDKIEQTTKDVSTALSEGKGITREEITKVEEVNVASVDVKTSDLTLEVKTDAESESAIQETIRDSSEKFSPGKDTPQLASSRKSSVAESEKGQDKSPSAPVILSNDCEKAEKSELAITESISSLIQQDTNEKESVTKISCEIEKETSSLTPMPESQDSKLQDILTGAGTAAAAAAAAVAGVASSIMSRPTRDSEVDTDDDEEVERRCSVASVMGDDRVPDDLDDGEEDKMIRPSLIDGEYKDAADIETSRESQFGSESKVLDDDQPMTDEPPAVEDLVMDKEVMTGSVVQIDINAKVEESSQLSTPQTEIVQEDKTKVSPTTAQEESKEIVTPNEPLVTSDTNKENEEACGVKETPVESIQSKKESNEMLSKQEEKCEVAQPVTETESFIKEASPTRDQSKKDDAIPSTLPSASIPDTPVKKEERSRPAQIPSAIPSKIPRESREVIRTPDEVADLPMHEEVEPGTYETDEFVAGDDENEEEEGTADGEQEEKDQNQPHIEPLGPDEEEFSEEDHGVEAIEIARSPLPGTLPPTSSPVPPNQQVDTKDSAEILVHTKEATPEPEDSFVPVPETVTKAASAEPEKTGVSSEDSVTKPEEGDSKKDKEDVEKEILEEKVVLIETSVPKDIEEPQVAAIDPTAPETAKEEKDLPTSAEQAPTIVEPASKESIPEKKETSSIPSEPSQELPSALEPVLQAITSVVITPSTPPVSQDTTDEADSHFPIPEEVTVESEESKEATHDSSPKKEVEELEHDKSQPLSKTDKEDTKESKEKEIPQDGDKKESSPSKDENKFESEIQEIKTTSKYYEEIAIVEDISSQDKPKLTAEQIIEKIDQTKTGTEPTLETMTTTAVETFATSSSAKDVSCVLDETSGTMTTSFWKEIPSSSSHAEDLTQKDDDQASDKEKLSELPRDDGDDDTGGEDGDGGEHDEAGSDAGGLMGAIETGLLTAANTASAALVHQSAETFANIPSSPESGRTPERRESIPPDNSPASTTNESTEKIEMELPLPEKLTEQPSTLHLEKTPSPISEQEKHEMEGREKEKETSHKKDAADDDEKVSKSETLVLSDTTTILETTKESSSIADDLVDALKIAGGAVAAAGGAVVLAVADKLTKSEEPSTSAAPSSAQPETLKIAIEESQPGLKSPANTPDDDDKNLEQHVKIGDDEKSSKTVSGEGDIPETTVNEIASTAEIVVETADSAVSSAIETAAKVLEESIPSEFGSKEEPIKEEEVVEEVITKTIVERAITSAAETEVKSDAQSTEKLIEQIQQSMTTISHSSAKPVEEKAEDDDDGPGVVEEPCTQTFRDGIPPPSKKEDDEDESDKRKALGKDELQESVEKSMENIYHAIEKKEEEQSHSVVVEEKITKSKEESQSVTESINLMGKDQIHTTEESFCSSAVVEQKPDEKSDKRDEDDTKSIELVPTKESGESGAEKMGMEAAVSSNIESAPTTISPSPTKPDDVEVGIKIVEETAPVKNDDKEMKQDSVSTKEMSTTETTTTTAKEIEETKLEKTEASVEVVKAMCSEQVSEQTSSLSSSSTVTTEKCEKEIIKQETASIEKVVTSESKFEGKSFGVGSPHDSDTSKESKPETLKSPSQQLPPDEQHQQQQQPTLPETGHLTSQLELEGGGGGDDGGGGDGQGGNGDGTQVTKKKYKQLEDYADKIREAKAVFDTLLNVAKSGVALSSAVDECKKNAQEAIRRSLEAQEDYYKPVKPMEGADLPETPEEQGVTIYESLEQMARAGSILFGELVEKIETKEKEAEEAKQKALQAEKEKESGIEPSSTEEQPTSNPPEETSAEPDFSAEQAVTIALQHLHETFKTMETLGSPRRSSRHAAKRMCNHQHPHPFTCPHHQQHHHHHHHHHPPQEESSGIKDNVSVTSSEPEQDLDVEEERSASSAIFSQSTKSSMSVSLSSAASTTTLAESGVKSPDDEMTASEAETLRESCASFTSGVISETDEREERITQKSSIQESSSISGSDTEQKIVETTVAVEEQSVESSSSSLSQEHSQIAATTTTTTSAATSAKPTEQAVIPPTSSSTTTKVEETTKTSQEQHQTSSTSSSSSSTAAIFSEMRIIKGESSSFADGKESSSSSTEKLITSGTKLDSSEESDGTKTTTTTKTIFYDGDSKSDTAAQGGVSGGDSKTEPPNSGISFRTVTTTTTDISPGGTITKTTITRRVSSIDEEDIKSSGLQGGKGSEKSPKVPRRASATGSYSSSKLAAAENKVHAYSYVFGIAAEPDPEEPVDSSLSEASEASFPPPPPPSAFTAAPVPAASTTSAGSSGPPSSDLYAESTTSSTARAMSEYSEEECSSITSTNQVFSTVVTTSADSKEVDCKGEKVTQAFIKTEKGDNKEESSSLTTTTTTTRIISSSDDKMQQSSSIIHPTSTTTTTATPWESTSGSFSSEPQGTKEMITRTTRIETVTTSLGGDEPSQTTTVIRTRTESGGSRGSSGSGAGDEPSGSSKAQQDVPKEWGKPLGLPTIYPTSTNTAGSSEGGAEGGSLPGSTGPDSGNFNNSVKATPKKSASSSEKASKEPGTPAKHGAGGGTSSSKKSSKKSSKHSPIYVDLAYVPHHGNSHYCDSEFFRMIRGRYYVFSGLEPSREVFEGLLQGKQQWEDKNLDVTIIPTYDTDTLGYWVVDSEDALAEAKIDLAPSASRCTINLQDHETSCAAYRLEF